LPISVQYNNDILPRHKIHMGASSMHDLVKYYMLIGNSCFNSLVFTTILHVIRQWWLALFASLLPLYCCCREER